MTNSGQAPEPSDEDVERLAKAWMPFAVAAEREITEGWDGMEPPRLVWRVSAYLARNDPGKAKEFDKRFLSILD